MSLSTRDPPPTGWASYPFWAIATEKVISGRESEGLLSVYLDRGVIPYSEGGGLVHKPAESLEKYQLVEPGDFVMNNQQAWRGSVGVSKHRGIVSPAYLVFSLDKSRLLPEYASYMFRDKSYVEKYMLSSLSVGDIQRQIKWNHLRKITIHLPSKEEQQALVKYLDRETSRIDSLIEKKTRFIDLLKEKRQAVITKAVTKGLDPSAPMKDSGAEWVGEIPAHWNFGPLKYFGRLNGGAGFPDDEQGRSNGELPFYKVRDLGTTSASGYTQKPENYIDYATSKRLRAYVFKPNTVVFAKVGAALLLNRFRLLSSAACIDNNMMGYEPGPELVPQYAHYVLSLIRFNDIVNPGAVPSINEKQVSVIPICVPPAFEQAIIVEFLSRRLTNIDNLIERSNRSIELLKEHRSALITAAVTGKIDVRNPK